MKKVGSLQATSEAAGEMIHSSKSPMGKNKRILREKKNGDSISLPETDNEEENLSISSEGTSQNIPSNKSPLENKKRGRKRGRPTKRSNPCSKKHKSSNHPWIGTWIKRIKIRKNGRKDNFYIHRYVPRLTCRSEMEVERYEKFGTRPGSSSK